MSNYNFFEVSPTKSKPNLDQIEQWPLISSVGPKSRSANPVKIIIDFPMGLLS